LKRALEDYRMMFALSEIQRIFGEVEITEYRNPGGMVAGQIQQKGV